MNKLYYYEKKSSVIWISIFVVFMTIFTFYDLPIAKAVFHYNDTYGEIFKIVGLLPTCIAGTFYAISNLVTRKIARRPIISAFLSIMSLILFIGFTLLSIYHLNKPMFIPAIIFNIVFLILSIVVNHDLARKADLFELRKVMIIALVSALIAVAGQTIIKLGFNRPRFIELTDPDTQFTYWFVHFPVTPDSSFPSGHAAQAALSFLLVYFKRFLPKLRTKAWDIAFLSFATFHTISTMLARMFLGAHYATDVWAGAFLTLFTISVLNQYVERSYMLPSYRASSTINSLRQLQEYTNIPGMHDKYESLIEQINTVDKIETKYDLILKVLHFRDDIDVLMLDERLSRRELVSLKVIWRHTTKFIREIKLKNFEDIYSAPAKHTFS